MSTEANVGAKVEDKLAALSLDENKTNGDNNTKRKKQRSPRLTEEEHLKQLEEEQAKKEIVRKDVTGTVKWYSVRSRYGFIKPDDQDDDIFVHQFAIAKSRIVKYFFRSLADGEKVVFDIVKGTKGEEAANVTGPDGANVQGVRFFPFYRRRHSTYKKEAGDDEEIEKKPKKRFFRRRRSHRKSQLTDSEDVKTNNEKPAKTENEKPKKIEAKKERGVDKSAGDAKEKNGSPKKVKNEARKSVDEKANKEESAKSGDEKKGKKPSPKTEKSKDEVAPGRRHRTNTESESVVKPAAVTPKKEADKKERQKSSVSEAGTPRKTSATPKKGETKVDEEAAADEEEKATVEPVKA